MNALMDACIICSDSADRVKIGAVNVHSPAKSGGRIGVVMTIETFSGEGR